MSCDEYPCSDETKEKNLRAKQKEGGKLTKTNINMARFDSRLFFALYIFSCFVFVLIKFSRWLVSVYSFSWPISASQGFCLSRISNNVDITQTYFFDGTSIAYRDQFEALGKFREHSNKVAKRSTISWNSTRGPHKFARELRVVQFVLKIEHLTISMEWYGPRACGLLLRL